MVNSNYYWLEIDNNKIGNAQVMPISQTIVRDVLGVYLTSPIERSAIKKLPTIVRDIERLTRQNSTTHDESQIWSKDKEGQFQNFLKDGYNELMGMRLEEIITKYIPQEEKRNWGKGLTLADFIGEKHTKGKKIEGTGLPKVKDKGSEELRELKLGDLLSKTNREIFTGKKTKIGRTKEAKAQRELDTNMRKFTNKEFFDEDNLSRITVKYVGKPNRTKLGINVTFTVDQTSGEYQRKIFKEAGYNKIVFKDDPTSYGLSIRDKWSPNWDDTSAEGELFQSKRDGKFDPISIWTGSSEDKEKKRKEHIEQLESQGNTQQEKALNVLAGISGRYSTLEKRLEKLKKELENEDSPKRDPMYGLRIQSPKPKEGESKRTLKEQVDDLEEFLEYIRNYHPKVFNGERTFAQERKYIEKLKGKGVTGQYITGRGAEAQAAISHFKDEKRSIQVTKDDIEIIDTAWKDFNQEHQFEDKASIVELINKWIDNGELYDLLAGRINNSPWYLHTSRVTLILNPSNVKGNQMYIPSIGKVTTTKMVSKEALDQPAQMQSLRQRKNIALPVTRKTGQGATQVMQDPKGATEKLGINSARRWWLRKIFMTSHNKLESAANEIGVSL